MKFKLERKIYVMCCVIALCIIRCIVRVDLSWKEM